jgi:preprotein translocase subunit SecE
MSEASAKKTGIVDFFREVRQEATKVTWPSRKETMITTAMVFAMSIVAAIFFFFVDQIISFAIRLILGLGG